MQGIRPVRAVLARFPLLYIWQHTISTSNADDTMTGVLGRSSYAKKRKNELSLCMIVKNEAETLDTCLRLARRHVDEIVVVDTGSTDGTQDIAREYADVYDEIEWPGSFSEARNYSLELASGKYILVLDGDEYIPNPLHWKRIRKTLRGADVTGARLRLCNVLAPTSIVATDTIWHERILRNHPDLRYKGRVHNQVRQGIETYMERTGEPFVDIHAEIVHTGYALDAKGKKEKYSARLELLREEYERAESDGMRAYYGYQLALGYFLVGRDHEAADLFNQLEYDLMTDENRFYSHLLATQTALRISNAPMALVHSNEMLKMTRDEPIAYFLTGLALLQARKAGDGLLMLLEAYNVNASRRGTNRFSLNTSQLLKTLAAVCMSAGLEKHAHQFRKMEAEGQHNSKDLKQMIASLKSGIARQEMKAAQA